MTSLDENTTCEPTVKKKKKACTKRRILRAQDNFEPSNVYSVGNICKSVFLPSSFVNGDSDEEEENLEQFQKKLSARTKTEKPVTRSQKPKQSYIETVSDEEGCDDVTPEDNVTFTLPSPSPPPPLPLEFEQPRYKHVDKTVRNLEKAYYNAVSTQHLEQGELSSFTEQAQSLDLDLESSFEIARNREEMTVKVRTKRGLRRFALGMYEPLIKIIISLAEEEDVDVNSLYLTCNAEQLNEEETPASLKLKVTDILDCVVIDPSNTYLQDISDLIPDEDKVDIKFQGQEKKSVFTFKLPKDESLKRALEAYSEFLATPLSNLKFSFDGEEVSSIDTPEHLDMEEQGTIDVTRH